MASGRSRRANAGAKMATLMNSMENNDFYKEQYGGFEEETSKDISSIVSQRLNAMKKSSDNPNDSVALKDLYDAKKEMSNWANSKNKPGQFIALNEPANMDIDELNKLGMFFSQLDGADDEDEDEEFANQSPNEDHDEDDSDFSIDEDDEDAEEKKKILKTFSKMSLEELQVIINFLFHFPVKLT